MAVLAVDILVSWLTYVQNEKLFINSLRFYKLKPLMIRDFAHARYYSRLRAVPTVLSFLPKPRSLQVSLCHCPVCIFRLLYLERILYLDQVELALPFERRRMLYIDTLPVPIEMDFPCF